jgi:hypothetical protein
VQTEISIFTYSSSSLVGFEVEINGSLTDFEGEGISNADIVVSYSLPDISEWIPFIFTTTDFQGDYYSQWIPPSTGDFTLKAEWACAIQQYGALTVLPYYRKNLLP